ncbi:phage tail assembly chaperone [Pelosinus propionicus]|uniref:Phage XkdN-like tail assembly chaperone protein, TAC n=1 Tax=Pelosinus propionicus DSM 13327 TaxID=1123291 RepID=A0A1I4P1D2_9FIRM|nr:phage portal protein [Pelosinus propionicus]SFM21611.1 Phage XkdN-like tail assembly chaperone protein, TAC [Pelosinus propionicus DSM 13327]
MDMSVFMKGKAKQLPEEEKVITKLFEDEEGQPIPFKFKAITTTLIDKLKADCTTIKYIKGQRIESFDRDRFSCRIGIETTVFPDFKNAELLQSYNCIDPVDLAKTVLNLGGEYTEWIQTCSRINGFDDTIEDVVKEAKN